MDLEQGNRSTLTYSHISGNKVSLSILIAEIKQWPLDVMLGYLGWLSRAMAITEGNYLDEKWQNEFIQYAMADTFPKTLPIMCYLLESDGSTSTRYRLDSAFDSSRILIHEESLAILVHLAILHCPVQDALTEVSATFKKRICRLFMIVNDLFGDSYADESGIPRQSLLWRKRFASRWARLSRYQNSYNVRFTLISLARQYKLITIIRDLLGTNKDAIATNLDFLFERLITFGVNLDHYFACLMTFAVHVCTQQAATAGVWNKLDELFENTRDISIQIMLRNRWMRSLKEYRDAALSISPQDTISAISSTALALLRESPFIATSESIVICPSVSAFNAKVEVEIDRLLKDFWASRESTEIADSGDLGRIIGQAFEIYAQGLLERIFQRDITSGSVKWKYQHGIFSSVKGKKAEIADTYGQLENLGVAVELKGKRYDKSFESGTNCDSVVGPQDECINRLQQGEFFSPAEGHKLDHGFLTEPMWQQSMFGDKLVTYGEQMTGIKPSIIYPLIIHLSVPRVDKSLYEGYFTHLIRAAKLYNGSYWKHPNWLYISDLEMIAEFADQGKLNFSRILEERESVTEYVRLDVFLRQRLGQVYERNLLATIEKLCNIVVKDLFGIQEGMVKTSHEAR